MRTKAVPVCCSFLALLSLGGCASTRLERALAFHEFVSPSQDCGPAIRDVFAAPGTCYVLCQGRMPRTEVVLAVACPARPRQP